MRIIISDSSCLIDLRRANLLTQFLDLPFKVLIPNTLFEDELVSFSDAEKKLLLDLGLGVVDLSGTQVARAHIVIREKSAVVDPRWVCLGPCRKYAGLCFADR